MGAILPFAPAGAFEPNDIQAMSLAYEDICNALHINGNISARETIAVRVIELTRREAPLIRQHRSGFFRVR